MYYYMRFLFKRKHKVRSNYKECVKKEILEKTCCFFLDKSLT